MADSTSFELSDWQVKEFDKAFELVSTLVDFEEVNEQAPTRGNAVFNASVVLWMLIFQRLSPSASLKSAVKHLLATRPQYLPDNKRVREGKLSTSTAAYSAARSKLPLEVVQWFANEVSQAIVAESAPLFNGVSSGFESAW